MAPALRMTRSIKEKLKIFLRFDSHPGLPFCFFLTFIYQRSTLAAVSNMPACSSIEYTNSKHVLISTAWRVLYYFEPNGPPTQHDFIRR